MTSARATAMAELHRSGKTLREIGVLYSVSRERVRQILARLGGNTEGYVSAIPSVDREVHRAARFWFKVDKSGGPDACWPWTGYINKVTGYGRVNLRLPQHNGLGAHQAAYFFTYGGLDPQLIVMHTCDNKPCCNPRHLREDTHKVNTQDAIQKGRKRQGHDGRYERW
jgi:hypothetical protein